MLWLAGLVLLGVLALAAVVGIGYASTDIPDPNEFAQSQSSIIYYADGETELARFTGGTDRELVSLDEVPEHAQEAMLSAEDRGFYDNEGVSPAGIARAAWNNLTSDSTAGGSTITQQYVKNYYLTSEQSYRRKFQELLIAVKIDRELSKDEILERYLNTIYYGRGAYGIQTAAQAYFGKDASEVDISEGAFLAAVTNAPSLLDPGYAEGNQQRAQERFEYVVEGMVSQGWISEAEGDDASFPEIRSEQQSEDQKGPTGYLMQTVRQELVDDLEVSEDDIDRGGLRITSTIIRKHQEAAETAVAEEMPDSPDAEDLRAGLVSVTPGDGAVTAMYGGADYQEEQLNIATDARQQAGSLFKVFALIAALQDDVSTQNTYSGASPMQFDIPGEAEPAEINNFRDEQFGEIDLRTATANSVNTVFVQLNQQIGPENTSRVARELGLPEDTEGLEDNLTNVLGTASPTMLDMTSAFATVAAEGRLAQPYIVAEVSSTNDTYDYSAEPDSSEVVDPDIAADVTDAMTRVLTEGSGTGAGDLGRPAAGKSGTSSNNLSAWFSGFTPQLAASVMMYEGDGTEPMQDIAGVDQITGGTFPVQVWGEFFRLALDGDEVVSFPPRTGVNDNQVVAPEPPATTQLEPTQPEETQPEPTQPEETQPEPTQEAETTSERRTTSQTETAEPEATTQEPETQSAPTNNNGAGGGNGNAGNGVGGGGSSGGGSSGGSSSGGSG
ncbi:MAG TPA: transglycosylase domain-containing protein, partial [Ornithinimicrobium sp.]|uniref:transglycosylase domain-containing protein n=1 Tax=Ornithinimicrobium sp. TaxID=1977084 RepID=UPI002B49A3AB